MAWISPEVHDVLSRIDDLNLPHPSGPLLYSFILGAVEPHLAAQYLSPRLSPVEAREAVSVWAYIVNSITEVGRTPPPPDALARRAITKRDGGKCCITGKRGCLWDPLVIVPILLSPSGWAANMDNVQDMLGAFFGPQYRDWWLAYARDPEYMSPYQNHWLVRASAAKAFAKGQVRLNRLHPSMIEFRVTPVFIGPEHCIALDGEYALLGDHSRMGIKTVDARFVGTQARFSKSIQYLELAKQIAPGILGPSLAVPLQVLDDETVWHPTLPASRRKLFPVLSEIPMRVFLSIWLALPNRLRLAAYDVLLKVGKMLYAGPNDYSAAHRLPFGLFLKYSGDPIRFRNELNALQTVRQHTSVPVPKPIDVLVKNVDWDSLFPDHAYLLTTALPGIPLSDCEGILSDRDCAYITGQLQDYLTQIRAIPRSTHANRSGVAICNSLGEACGDNRISGGRPVGPFPDEAAFSALLRFPDDPARRGHKILFTHADLNPRNILVDRIIHPNGRPGWQVTGIVDWETAGYYPEYWDYTKAMFERFRWTRRYLNTVKDIFAGLGDYSKELDVEVRSWEMGDGI